MVTRRIPLDLIVEILTRLPAKSILRSKCVCKEWYNLINSPLFLKLHLNKSLDLNSQHNYILYWTTSSLCIVDDLYQPVKVTKMNWPKDTIRNGDRIYHVGSCNGLVCFKVIGRTKYRHVRCFLICNPTTRTFKSICPPSENTWALLHSSCGFGYDSEHDDYKIVATPRCIWREDDINKPVFIYSLKTDLWSSPTLLTLISTGSSEHTGALLLIKGEVILENNMLHFLVALLIDGSINEYKISRFDVVSEKWKDDLSLPVQVNCYVRRIGKLDGRLYLQADNDHLRSSDVWMMEEGGSWKKMFQLPECLNNSHNLIARSKDGHQLLLLQSYYGSGDVLKWYDQRNNKSIPLELKSLPKDKGSKIMLCTESLIGIPGCSLTKLKEIKELSVFLLIYLVYSLCLCYLLSFIFIGDR